MKLHIKVKEADGSIVMKELLVNQEDLFEMLDGIKPRVLGEYLAKRMKDAVNPMSKLVNIFNEGGDYGTL